MIECINKTRVVLNKNFNIFVFFYIENMTSISTQRQEFKIFEWTRSIIIFFMVHCNKENVDEMSHMWYGL